MRFLLIITAILLAAHLPMLIPARLYPPGLSPLAAGLIGGIAPFLLGLLFLLRLRKPS